MRRGTLGLCALFAPTLVVIACGSSVVTPGTGGSSGASTTPSSSHAAASSASSAASSGATTSSSGTGGVATGSSSGTGAGATSSSSGAGTGGSPTDAGKDAATTCEKTCEVDAPLQAIAFEGHDLQECACMTGAPCASECTSECANPSSLVGGTPCSKCLRAQLRPDASSTCTAAALADCENDPKCAPFASCLAACADGGA